MPGSTPIGESSAITISLAVVFLGLAFSLGIGYQRLDSTERTVERLSTLIEQQAEMIRQQSRRLDLAEQAIADIDLHGPSGRPTLPPR